MRINMLSVLAAGLIASGAAHAQTNTSGSQSAQPGTASSSKQLVTAQRLKQDLEKAGFSDVNVVAESFVVRAKSKDGDPVLMTIGPHGMAIFEAAAERTNTTGSTGNAARSSGAAAGSGADQGSGTKK